MPAAVAVVGLAASAYAANQSSKAAKGAANTQAQAARDANGVQLQIYNQQRADNEPFRQNALTAQNEYMALLGLGQPQAPQPQGVSTPNTSGVFANNPFDGPRKITGYNSTLGGMLGDRIEEAPLFGDTIAPLSQPMQPTTPMPTSAQQQQTAFDRFRNTPGYQFGLQTGFNQVQSSAAAHGGLYSGATMKALQKFGNDYADQQGYTPYMNRLATLAGMGQTANAQNAQAGQNYANQTGNNLLGAGNARASGLLGQANARNQLAGNIAGIGGWLGGQYTWGGV